MSKESGNVRAMTAPEHGMTSDKALVLEAMCLNATYHDVAEGSHALDRILARLATAEQRVGELEAENKRKDAALRDADVVLEAMWRGLLNGADYLLDPRLASDAGLPDEPNPRAVMGDSADAFLEHEGWAS